jgi:DNA polymerase IV
MAAVGSSMDAIRKIIHIDMDAFYASVEQRDHPELKGKPVIVGGDPQSRGVVAACSYAAREFGIHSAMPSITAYRLCPHAVFIRPRFDVYKSVSLGIREIFYGYTDIVEPLSLDEAFLDVTENKIGMPSATHIAQDIRRNIYKKTGGLTASAGVSFNKFLAKVASDVNKPNGITVITPDQAAAFVDRLPVRKFFGVGRVTEDKMVGLGIKTGSDLKKYAKHELIQIFGKAGNYFYDIAHGLDNRPVKPDRIRKSVGKEITLKEDIDDIDRIIQILEDLAVKVVDLLSRENRKGVTVTLKVKYFDFQSITRSVTLPEPVKDVSDIMTHVIKLLGNTEAGHRKLRLLGITVSGFSDKKNTGPYKQIPLPFK